MDKTKLANEIVTFFYEANSSLMPSDPKERLRFETLIRAKVHSDVESGFEETEVIHDLESQLKKLRDDSNSWFYKQLQPLKRD